MADVCAVCEGAGVVVVERADGSRAARECGCREMRREERRYEKAQIPSLYRDRSLENYQTTFPGATMSLGLAITKVRTFVEHYRQLNEGSGLLFTGSVGTGKTHLAVGALKGLMYHWQVQGLFCHYSELLKQIQNSYNPQVQATELEILRPVFEAEVLVLDELGASKPTEWVKDTVGHILNVRYNERRTTIITTNYVNAPETSRDATRAMNDAHRAMFTETLGDRIGERMRSRLQEMCVVVPVDGLDYRAKEKLASL